MTAETIYVPGPRQELSEAALRHLAEMGTCGLSLESSLVGAQEPVSGRAAESTPSSEPEATEDIGRDNSCKDPASLNSELNFALEEPAEEFIFPWQGEALCAQTDPEAFFPEKGGSTREAKRVCSRCDVRVECLEYALGHDERFGIWGGLSERERRRLKRRKG